MARRKWKGWRWRRRVWRCGRLEKGRGRGSWVTPPHPQPRHEIDNYSVCRPQFYVGGQGQRCLPVVILAAYSPVLRADILAICSLILPAAILGRMLYINPNPDGWGRIWLPKLWTGVTPHCLNPEENGPWATPVQDGHWNFVSLPGAETCSVLQMLHDWISLITC